MGIRYVMVGGGPGALIGEAHRLAARASGFELVAGAFSSDLERSRSQAEKSGLAAGAGYGDWPALISDAGRLGAEAIVIVTPNHLHAPIALAALEAGLHVICDKPLCTSAGDARAIVKAAMRAERIVGLTHTYAGYASIAEAARRVRAGAIGRPRLILGHYIQDWLTKPIEREGVGMAAWRLDPARSGPAGAAADIGTHAYHMAGMVSGMAAAELSAELSSFVEGRRLDDTALVRLRYPGGARGVLTISQAVASSGGSVRFEIMGDEGGIGWRLERPHDLTLMKLGGPAEVVTVETPGPLPEVPGAPAGFLNAFAALYGRYAAAIGGASTWHPDARDGLEGMKFIEAAVRSSAADGAWTQV
ncbi:MAG: Gfo/Idh/MocA family oxidoreductase [Alphaproteobacteria bacterium]|nr:Gfo/Idh/MocA family oxidoreductase [Alphaproteobacteria bacterium]